MHPLEAAVLRTVLYADVFDFALTPAEIHRYLIHTHSIDLDTVLHTLHHSDALKACLHDADGLISLRPELFALRREREAIAARLWVQARRWGARLAAIPFVRMVGVTGALAMNNPSSARDDLDYLLITRPGRVWLARALAVALVRVGRLCGVELCPNFVVAADALAQKRRDLYVAHEIAQVVPLFGGELYAALFAQNEWLYRNLPNAHTRDFDLSGAAHHAAFKRLAEWILRGKAGDYLESWERKRKQRRFQRQQQAPSPAAVLDASQVKGHFQDHGSRVLQAYQARLQQYGLADLSHASHAAD